MGHWDPILQNIVLECQWPLQHAYGAEKSAGKIHYSNNRAMNILNQLIIITPIITKKTIIDFAVLCWLGFFKVHFIR